VSEEANIKALGEKVKKIKTKINRTKTLVKYLVVGYLILMVFLVVLLAASMSALQSGGHRDAEFFLILLSLPVASLCFVGLAKGIGQQTQEWTEEEDALKKKLLTLLYPTPNCNHCGKPLTEGNKFCTYCGNTRYP